MCRKIFFIGFLFITVLCSCNADAQKVNLSADEFEAALAKGNVQLLDVRTAAEYESGHLSNALQANWNNTAEFEKRTQSLSKSKPVYVYCLGGGRSSAAADWLSKQGYNAFNLVGGITKWKQAGKAVEQNVVVAQLTREDYNKLIATDKTVLVDFGAKWCPPCRKMDPIIDSLVKNNPQLFELVKIDGGTQDGLVQEMMIEEFPTFIVYKQGKQSWRANGLQTYDALLKQLQ